MFKLYTVRKSYDDTKSQIGIYCRLANAIKACKSGYKVYNLKSGKVCYVPKHNIDYNKIWQILREHINLDKIEHENFNGICAIYSRILHLMNSLEELPDDKYDACLEKLKDKQSKKFSRELGKLINNVYAE